LDIGGQIHLLVERLGDHVNPGMVLGIRGIVKPHVETLHLKAFCDSLLDFLYQSPHALLFNHIQTIKAAYVPARNYDGMTGSDRVGVR
jgi:hypothetical protein